jgi:transcriptional repressor NrdR
MRCPWCGNADDKVVDSRPAERGEAIRRRRQCLACGRRFTTYERVEELGLTVAKRGGMTEPWNREKMLAGIRKALVNRPVTEEQRPACAARARGSPPNR